MAQRVLKTVARIAMRKTVDQKVCFKKDLMIDTVNGGERVMLSYQRAG